MNENVPNEEQAKDPIAPILRALGSGHTHAFPLSRMNTVKATCTMLRLVHNFRYTTHVNRESKTIEVTRLP